MDLAQAGDGDDAGDGAAAQGYCGQVFGQWRAAEKRGGRVTGATW